jgi:putative radical SAM enzyme (TIGR03279 family)
MSETRKCRNKCIFCFIDQQPPGLRQSLYVKDDDARLSFLMGNYVTLTNLSREEIERIANYHLSPLRISVHTTNPDLRKKMMNCENAANLNEAIKVFSDAGIQMHFQIVLCKGINDGENLSRTIRDLMQVKGAESLAVVPAGLTRHREKLYPLEQFSPQEAEAVIALIESFGNTFVFAADEWYILAKKNLPEYEQYKNFPQLDNGVGMLRLFEHEFLLQKKSCKPAAAMEIGIITGHAAQNFMRRLADAFTQTHPSVTITIHAITNHFFGENITVSGLLTGTDIIAQLSHENRTAANILFLPENAFRANTDEMLDGTTLQSLSAKLGVPVKKGSTNGKEFYNQLIEAVC